MCLNQAGVDQYFNIIGLCCQTVEVIVNKLFALALPFTLAYFVILSNIAVHTKT